MPSGLLLLLIVVGGVIIVFMGGIMLLAKFYRKVDQGKALIVNTMRAEPDVTFTGRHVLPIFHRAEAMDISVKTVEIDRRGKDGLICQDNIRADIKVTFFVRVNKTREDVLKVAQMIGCVRASDQQTLEDLFSAKFSEALKTVGKQLDFIMLYTHREEFKDRIVEVIGRDLNGYVLEDAAIDFLEQTPLKELDEDNILDAQGIRKITELTTVEHIATNLASNNEKKQITAQDVETVEMILEQQRRQADAEAKQARQVAEVRAREAAETAKVQAEEKQKAELARIKSQQEIQVQEENRIRQVEVAKKNRERVVGVETERVQKDRDLEAITRERETELSRISKEKALEEERKLIAEVIRERIAIDKTVAEEEEAIKALRVIEEARRAKEAVLIGAQAEAGESMEKQVRAAEASEKSAKFMAQEKLHIAEAELEAADKLAQAKIRLAEGVQAEQAAEGLARAKVKEADAAATEKMGLAEARCQLEGMNATAKGEEAQGMARVAVKEADAGATEKLGLAEANVLREKGLAEATATEKTGVAEAQVLREKGLAEAISIKERGLARAAATKEQGLADATAIGERLNAEAHGLAEKAKSMDALGFEEFRLKLDKEKAVQIEAIQTQARVAEAQGRVLGEAFTKANIDIVSGEQSFIERVVGAVGLGKTADAFIEGSDSAKTLLKDYLSGEANLPADLKEVLTRPRLGSDDIQSLTVSALLGKLVRGTDDSERKQKLTNLLDAAKDLGL